MTTSKQTPASASDVDFEEIVDRFDYAWRSDPPADIGRFLGAVGQDLANSSIDRRRLLAELVKVDMEYRWRPPPRRSGADDGSPAGGAPVTTRLLDDYLADYPELAEGGSPPLDLIGEEYLVRHRFGDRPGHAEFFSRFATHETELARLLTEIDRQLAVPVDTPPASLSRFADPQDAIESLGSRASLGTIVDSVVQRRDSDGAAPRERTLAAAGERTYHEAALSSPAAQLAMTAEATSPVARFVDELRNSRVLSLADCEAVAAVATGGAFESPRDLAARLVADGLLTDFQADAMLRGAGRNLVLGEYVLLSKIGEGGMGAVFKARHRRMRRLVALKVLSPAITRTEDGLRRFHREVQTAARLHHPNIVLAHDASEEHGQHYLVMELVEGTNVRQIVRQHGPIPVAKAVEIVIQAARGLAFAHAAGIVHRDIKPDNLLVAPDGAVKILDLGLARLLDVAPREGVTLTGSGSIVGTPEFMPPEQATNAHDVDARADIYSLGCTLYFMLVGKPPFEAESVFERLMAHRDQPIPSLASVRGAAGALDAVFRRMLAKRPTDRPATMDEVIRQLEQATANAVNAPPASSEIPEEPSEIETPLAHPPPQVSTPTVGAPARPPSWRDKRLRDGIILATLLACITMIIWRLMLEWR